MLIDASVEPGSVHRDIVDAVMARLGVDAAFASGSKEPGPTRENAKSADTESAVPAPRANPDLVGHEAAERELLRLYSGRRLPHAILLAGPRGIGKATLAFRFARFLLAQGGDAERPALDLFSSVGRRRPRSAIDPESGVFRRVAAGGHADLLTVERAWDPRRKRLRGEIVVEDTREIAAFFRLTAAEEGWRVVIVDGAEEMNRNAANAVLKILEEPPDRALLLLVSHNPGRLLPTIRSRCRRLALAPLPARAGDATARAATARSSTQPKPRRWRH